MKAPRKRGKKAVSGNRSGKRASAAIGKEKRDQAARKLVAARELETVDVRKVAAIARKDLEERGIPATIEALRLAKSAVLLEDRLAREAGNIGVVAKQLLRVEELLGALAAAAKEKAELARAKAGAPPTPPGARAETLTPKAEPEGPKDEWGLPT